jgi:hypothetical protein
VFKNDIGLSSTTAGAGREGTDFSAPFLIQANVLVRLYRILFKKIAFYFIF